MAMRLAHSTNGGMPMRILKIAGLSIAAAATLTVASAPAFAHPHRHQVCKFERHHGHKMRVCHWVG
jgi:hypothetical protein